VLRNLDELAGLLRALYPEGPPQPFAILEGVRRAKAGESLIEVARSLRCTTKRLEAAAAAVDPIREVIGHDLEFAASETATRRPRGIVGQLLLGELAERAFLGIYKAMMGTNELVLEDDRSSRTETDYRILNSHRRPVFRINIKFHGTLFRNAHNLVGLEPEDCFALATYKIFLGLQKQETERLPYLFVVVSVPGLTGSHVGSAIPEDLAHLLSLVHASPKIQGKRAIEERVVTHLLEAGGAERFQAELADFRRKIDCAEWRVLSARRADRLLRELLFERVYAVRVRAFARNYRNAELDMHFSLQRDLTPLRDFLANLRERGLHGLAVDLERGVI